MAFKTRSSERLLNLAQASALGVLIVVTILAFTITYRVVCHPRRYCTLSYHWRTPGVRLSIDMMLEQPGLEKAERLASLVTNTSDVSDWIPRVIYQTYHSKHLIPTKVSENMKRFAPQFIRHVFNDSECSEFLRKHFHRSISDMFYQLEGPHRSDVFRYAVLYTNGGVYIDIKTELLVPLVTIISKNNINLPAESSSRRQSSIVDKAPVQRDVASGRNSVSDQGSRQLSRPVTYSVLSGGSVPRTLFQGVIASPKGNPLFLKLIQDFLETTKPIRDYFITTRTIYETICEATSQRNLTAGLNSVLAATADPNKPTAAFDYYLFEEKKRRIIECYDGADRHHGCYFIFRGDDKIMKVRYADYPWESETKRGGKSSQFPIIIDFKKWGV